MNATVPSATILGVEGLPVRVEVHVGVGLPGFMIVGQPDSTCREARDRVRAALQSSDLVWPPRRVTVNLAPSGTPKMGAGLDLPIAIALLVASEQLPPAAADGIAFVGELGLDGTIRSLPGLVSLADAITAPTLVVPAPCASEAQLVGRHRVHAVTTLAEVVSALRGLAPWPGPPPPAVAPAPQPAPDLCEVRGQHLARFALEVAAAGAHHLLFTGPPGAGKTMLARRLVGLLPPLTPAQALEVTRIHSAAGMMPARGGIMASPPFRSPHHSASAVALVGGGSATVRPGEVSMATNGILFLDEISEFPTTVLDHLRQPLEEGVIRICRAQTNVELPARFLLVAAMNPCRCGYGGAPGGCTCPPSERARAARRLSGPLLDRFDLRIQVGRPEVTDLLGGRPCEPSAAVATRVLAARQRAADRGVTTNARLPSEMLDVLAPLSAPARRLLEHRLRTGSLSARGLHRVRRVALTVADLAGHDGPLGDEHLCAAIEMRIEPMGLAAAS